MVTQIFFSVTKQFVFGLLYKRIQEHDQFNGLHVVLGRLFDVCPLMQSFTHITRTTEEFLMTPRVYSLFVNYQ